MKIVAAHKTVSRECTDADVRRIARDAEDMIELFGKNTVALAHPQVEDKDPLRFFEMAENFLPGAGLVIVNPVIKRHSSYTVDSKEGCHTWPEREHLTVQRWRKCDVVYQTLDGKTLSAPIEAHLVGFLAYMFQHEVDHLEGKYCYND